MVAAVLCGAVRLRWPAPDGSVRWWRAGSRELHGGRMIELSDETDYDGGPVAAVPGTATWDWDVVTDRMRLSPALLDMLIHRLDRWVLGRAVRALATPRARALGLRLEANISGRSLEDPDFGPWVLAELRRHGVEPARLGVEVTETAAVTDLAAARSLAAVLIDSGVGFALDDFGAGFGSFAYLKHLRFTSVKIAGDFVAHVDHDHVDRALVSAVVVVARRLGLVTVAEQVDRPELVDDLRELGVDHGQGYHLGRPVPLDRLIGMGAAPGRTG